ncbi:LytR C-terminal domain-containing protein [Kribbella catacumbae]|uniref:LytR C-terminal domain-containing protein n=1 Tax=Kribbella catacumbae TaxID=460086 RepID=UPI0003700CB5|nr:LytR C-terminal domain-containing protein [Kribbella catacumbae]
MDDRGQVLSSLVAVLAVVAIVGGLLVLFGTRGNNSVADEAKPAPKSTPSKPSGGTPTSAPTSAPVETPPAKPSTSAPVEPTPTPSATPSSAPSSVPTAPASIPASERPAVEVYNNTARKGLAEDVAIRARKTGWIVTGKDNWHGKIVTSTVYFPAGMQAEAAQLAKDIEIFSTKDALPNMKKDRLSVILTTDYAG